MTTTMRMGLRMARGGEERLTVGTIGKIILGAVLGRVREGMRRRKGGGGGEGRRGGRARTWDVGDGSLRTELWRYKTVMKEGDIWIRMVDVVKIERVNRAKRCAGRW